MEKGENNGALSTPYQVAGFDDVEQVPIFLFSYCAGGCEK
jgi:hypothetical protein